MKRLKPLISRPPRLIILLCVCWCLPASALTTEEAAGFRERYLETLRLLTSDGIEVATGALLELETAVAQQHGAAGLDRLGELELGVASELAQIDAKLLLPLIALHERIHLENRRQTLDANPYQSRTLVYLQTQLYSEQMATTGERGVASDLFVSLAGHFLEGSPGPGAVGLYTRALQFDPANAAALLGLATAREQTGRYRNALALLERLVETGAADAEAWLRLAINLERLGEGGEAERILARLTSEPTDDWVLILAFQQLARIRMDQERFESAHTYLVRGLTRFPEDFGLAVGLSYVEERLGLEPAQPLATRIPTREAAVARFSARYRYARPGHHYIEATRERLHEVALQSLPDLARALSSLADSER